MSKISSKSKYTIVWHSTTKLVKVNTVKGERHRKFELSFCNCRDKCCNYRFEVQLELHDKYKFLRLRLRILTYRAFPNPVSLQ